MWMEIENVLRAVQYCLAWNKERNLANFKMCNPRGHFVKWKKIPYTDKYWEISLIRGISNYWSHTSQDKVMIGEFGKEKWRSVACKKCKSFKLGWIGSGKL